MTEPIYHYSTRFGIPPKIVSAIIEVESERNPWATRHEPHYRFLWNVSQGEPWHGQDTPHQFPHFKPASAHTEYMAQKTSWGMMQVMGAVARELGFTRPFLSELCDPDVGVYYGCKLLAKLYKRYGDRHGWEGVVAAYNAGSPRQQDNGQWENQHYVSGVIAASGLPQGAI